MTNIFKNIFNDDSIIGLCSIKTEEEKLSKWKKIAAVSTQNLNSSIIFQRNLNRFVLNQSKTIDQIPYYVSSSSQSQRV